MDNVKSPTVSIIIPVYNASETIDGIVSSISGQTFQDFELILIDDGSTDSTLNILRGLKARDTRIVI
jgi:glycosyltransferase involved in cell wall biosynthesis